MCRHTPLPKNYKEFYGLLVVYTFSSTNFLARITYEEENELKLFIKHFYAKYGWTMTECKVVPFTSTFQIDNPRHLYSCIYKNHYIKCNYDYVLLMPTNLDCPNKPFQNSTIKYVIPVKLINNNYARND